MRVISKFAIAFFVLSLALLSLFAYSEGIKEAKRSEALIVTDLEILGATLRDAVTATWEASNQEAALRTLEHADRGRESVQIAWVETAEPGPRFEKRAQGDEQHVHIRVPVAIQGQTRGVLELTRPLPKKSALVREAFLDEARFAFFLAIAEAVLAIVIGAAVVGRPLQRIVTQARRIADGDFSQRLRSDRKDEIGFLKKELNVMCDRLEAARAQVEAETNARIATLDQLRHLDRLRTVGTIASSIAHELGTPLNVLLIRGQSLQKNEVPPDQVPDAGATIVNQVEKMSRIVRSLLGFARQEGKRKKDPIALTGVAKGAVGLLSSVAKRSNVSLSLESEGEPTTVGDSVYVEQALTNLIVNAIQAMPQGGKIVVRVSSAKGVRPPRSTRTVDVARVQVTDQGTGIEEANLPRLFEPFFTTKEAGRGTGLGLSVASGIAEEHDGWIDVETRIGIGSTFTLNLPSTS